MMESSSASPARTELFNGPIMAAARTLTALSTLLTISFTPTEKIFAPSEGREDPIKCDGAIGAANIFCLNGDHTPRLGILLSIIVLSLVIIGILPWITSILHLYIAFYFQQNLAIPDGGDQVAVFITLMLAVVYFGDLRLNHWSAASRKLWWQPYSTVTGAYLLKCQMTIIYLNASIHKMATDDWIEGSELYYLLGGSFEPSGILKSVYRAVVDQPFLGVGATWGAALVELFLGATILMGRKLKIVSLAVGILFHVGIALFLGITSFQIVMIAGLLVLCVPTDSKLMNGHVTVSDFQGVRRPKNRQQEIDAI